MEQVRVLAVDCATQAKRIGLAAGYWSASEGLVVEEAVAGDSVGSISDWLSERAQVQTVLALDAPLGWPAPLGNALHQHCAGDPIATTPNELFRRSTDTFVHGAIGKLPLDVGADRIARTAHAALTLLREVREQTGLSFDVTSRPYDGGTVALECYPGGTLRAGPWDERGYKGKDGEGIRRRLFEELGEVITFGDLPNAVTENDDVFDAVVAALGAADYLENRCFEPQDAALVAREGWIWVRRPSTA